MNGRQFRETERNIKAEEFLRANVGDFQSMPMILQMTDELTARIAKVQQEFQNQLAAGGDVRQNYDIVQDNYETLESEMQNIRDFAKTISRRTPAFDELFRIPKSKSRRGLIAAARVFTANAEKNKQKFLDFGIEDDFIDELSNAADALENALNDAAESTGKRVGATDMLGIEIEEASDIVDDINPLVRRVYRNNLSKQAQWDFVRRVERRASVPRQPKQPKE